LAAGSLDLTPTPARKMPGRTFASGRTMEAIIAILIFVVVILALNRYEFGRFD
jgi:ribose/xylose/arabinose/galactoside ABC-type transport system permease subunit